MTGSRPANPKGLDGMAEYANLIQAMQQRGWDDSLIRNVMGENWLRFYDSSFGSKN